MNKSKITVALLMLLLSNIALSKEFNIGDWRLGMTKDEVRKTYPSKLFKKVKITGGIETQYEFLGRELPISFVFNNEKLVYIQLFVYEGKSYKEAKDAAVKLHAYMASEFGGAAIEKFKIDENPWISSETAEVVVDKTIGIAPEYNKMAKQNNMIASFFDVDMRPKEQPKNCRVHAKIQHNSRIGVYYVFLFQDEENVPDRNTEVMVMLEKL